MARKKRNPTQREIAQDVLSRHQAGERSAKERITGIASPAARVTVRTKTLESTLGKIARKPKYSDPSLLEDVTGMRVVEPTIDGVKATVRRIKARFPVVAEDDYISRPRENYRSHHLIIRDDDGLLKEVQVRTPNQDEFANWSHHVYKPPTKELAEVRDANRETIEDYERRMSQYFHERDLGFLRVKKPPCPAVVAQNFGCVGNMPRNNPVDEDLIRRIRQMIGFGLSLNDVANEFASDKYTPEEVFLAYHAAKIMDKHDVSRGNPSRDDVVNPKVVPWSKGSYCIQFVTRKGETLWTGDGWKHSMDFARDDSPALFFSKAEAAAEIKKKVIPYIRRWQPGYDELIKGR